MEGIYITQSRVNWSQPQAAQQYTGFVLHYVKASLTVSKFTNCTREHIIRYAEDRHIENPAHFYVQHPADDDGQIPSRLKFSI